MSTEQGGSLDRLFSGLRRWWAENIIDLEPQPDIGSDDDGGWVRIESAQTVRPHVELNGCGCDECTAALEIIRRALLAEADLADINRIAALPVAEQQQ